MSKDIMYGSEGQQQQQPWSIYLMSLDDALTTFYTYRQGSDESLSDYLDNFRHNVAEVERCGGTIGNESVLIAEVKARPGAPTEADQLAKLARDRALVVAFLLRADTRRYGNLMIELENLFTRGVDQYPADLAAAYNFLANYRT